MRHILSIFVGICMVMCGPQANASTQSGKVIYVIVRASDGLIYFELDGYRDTKPVCASGNYFMIKSESGLAGRQQYAMLLAAKAAGKTVLVSGAGQCTRWNDGEDADAIRITD